MFEERPFGGDRSSWSYLVAVLLAAFLIAAGPVFGQLTDQDIEEMRRRAKVEGWTFTVGRTSVSDYSPEELHPTIDLQSHLDSSRFRPIVCLSTIDLPARFDWRDSAGVTPVKNQLSCGSCWAFATVGVVESAIKLTDGIEENLSEQWLVSCDGYGCNGGWLVFDYFIDYGDKCLDPGCPLESAFPYVAEQAPCLCPYPGDRYFIDAWWYVGYEGGPADVPAIKNAMLQYGPVTSLVYASPEFDAYTGGVFNYCVAHEHNHFVTLVGWDDNLGSEGAWILRNSYGPYWGENGYMYIEYGCNWIGTMAAFVEYNGPIQVSAEPTCGEAPLDIQFSAFTGLADATDWQWDFGDGSIGTGQDPFHTYQDVGVYDVTVTVDTDEGIRSSTREKFIVAHADTIKADSIRCQPDTKVEIELTANNTAYANFFRIPVEFPNDFSMRFDSVSTVGCRTEYFEVQDYENYDVWGNRRFTYALTASKTGTSPDLPPGEGPVLKIYFTIPASAPYDASAQIILDGYDAYLPSCGYRSTGSVTMEFYSVATVAGEIVVKESCCMLVGDVNHDGKVDPSDFQYLRDYLHKDGPEPPCLEEADVNGDGEVTREDMSCFARYLYSPGNACVFVPCE